MHTVASLKIILYRAHHIWAGLYPTTRAYNNMATPCKVNYYILVPICVYHFASAHMHIKLLQGDFMHTYSLWH